MIATTATADNARNLGVRFRLKLASCMALCLGLVAGRIGNLL
jgi:hypothetical protein